MSILPHFQRQLAGKVFRGKVETNGSYADHDQLTSSLPPVR